jgi:hypothetical protein
VSKGGKMQRRKTYNVLDGFTSSIGHPQEDLDHRLEFLVDLGPVIVSEVLQHVNPFLKCEHDVVRAPTLCKLG